MIKLEDLKIGDIIYHAYKYAWIMKVRIIKEIQIYDDNGEIACVEGRIIAPNRHNDNDYHDIERYDEEGLFKTYEEALKYKNNRKQEKINYLLKNDNLVQELFERLCRARVLIDEDIEIYKIAIDKRR